ncbi:MAG: PQQ-dependent sugar dehydrogenase, partial [Flavobacterium sp.]
DGTIPSDNPILNSVQSHIFSYGHRNAQGIVFGTNGNLYSNEHGPKSDDEINIIQSGGNYGWPFIAGFRDDKNYAYCNWSSAPTCASLSFSDYTCGTGATSTTESSWAGTFIDPITTLFTIDDGFNFTGGWLTWPTIGPSSIINYEGYSSPIPGWNNSLLSTTLKKGKIYRSILSGDGNSIIGNPEEILYTQNRYRDIAIDPNGKVLYVITDSGGTTSGPSGSSSLSVVNPGTILIFTHETFLNNETHESNPRNIIVYKNNSELKINSGEAIMSAIKIFDITGRLLFEENNIRSNNKTINKFVPTNNLLLIQVQTINNIQISKKVIF